MALLVPPPAAVEVEGLRRACGDANRDKVAAHATLIPPINVREDDVPEALAVVREVAASTPPLLLDLGPPTTFPDDHARTVLYLAVGGPDLARLHELQAALLAGPFERPSQHESFIPHVTISISLPTERVDAAIAALVDFRVEVTFDRLTALENVRDEDADRHVWRPLADAVLAGRSVVGRGGLELELTVSGSVDPEVSAWSEPAWEIADLADLGAVGEESTIVVTARRDGRAVGLLEGWQWADLAYVSDLIVAEDVRGEGIGRHLLARFEAEARSRGCTSLALRAVAGAPAEAVYRHLGWEAESVQRRWVHGKDFIQFRRWL